jgi:hypothetical protein
MYNQSTNENIFQYQTSESVDGNNFLSKSDLLNQYLQLKEQENIIKNQINYTKERLINGLDIKEGTNHFDIDGAKFKVKQQYTRKVNYENLKNDFSGKETPEFIKKTFRFKADLVLPAYRNLDPREKNIVDNYITTSIVSPSIEAQGEENE